MAAAQVSAPHTVEQVHVNESSSWVNETLKVSIVVLAFFTLGFAIASHFANSSTIPYIVCGATIGVLTLALIAKLAIDGCAQEAARVKSQAATSVAPPEEVKESKQKVTKADRDRVLNLPYTHNMAVQAPNPSGPQKIAPIHYNDPISALVKLEVGTPGIYTFWSVAHALSEHGARANPVALAAIAWKRVKFEEVVTSRLARYGDLYPLVGHEVTGADRAILKSYEPAKLDHEMWGAIVTVMRKGGKEQFAVFIEELEDGDVLVRFKDTDGQDKFKRTPRDQVTFYEEASLTKLKTSKFPDAQCDQAASRIHLCGDFIDQIEAYLAPIKDSDAYVRNELAKVASGT